MKFGRVDPHERIEFTLPADHPNTERVLRQGNVSSPLRVYFGANDPELDGNFHPKINR